MAIRIALAEDQRLVREAMVALLSREPDFELVGEAATGREAAEIALRERPDVLLLDISMPEGSGLEVARALHQQAPEVRMLALSVHTDAASVQGMMKAGAMGYVDKFSAFDELVRAIRTVMRGACYLAPQVTREALEETASELTAREREIIALLAEGRRSPQIAEALSISPATVETHRRNIMRKLGLHSVAALTRYALRSGLITL